MTQPTQEPVEELILQDLEAALKTIRTDDPSVEYWHDVFYVERINAGFPSFPSYPAIGLIPQGTDVDESLAKGEHSIDTHRLNLTILCWMDTRSDVAREMLRMNRDIRTALMQDPRRTGLAIHTYITNTRTHFSEEATAPISLVEISAYVAFRTQSTALEQAT